METEFGLVIVQEVLSVHEEHIELESEEAKGMRTRVQFWLPGADGG